MPRLKKELDEGDTIEAKEILSDLTQNLDKINHHGQRASSIVKGMLDHSRTSTGEKISTNINTLCDEYVRLAYHGMRAKDKSFLVKYETDFDPNLPKVDIVSQDIGRVILNLVNNAFQALKDYTPSEVESTGLSRSEAKDYQPLVKISTEHFPPREGVRGRIHVRISDNGPGIPEEIGDKIFQPFFTTKPTGQGTGLGLSLSYDIIKAHGGNIKLKSEVGQGSHFIISLPI